MRIGVTSHWYYRKWWHRIFRIKHVAHDCFPMEWRATPIKRFNKWVKPTEKGSIEDEHTIQT